MVHLATAPVFATVEKLMRVRKFMPCAVAVALLAAAHAAPAPAEVNVSGASSNVHMEVRDAPLGDILTALGQRFNLRIHGTVGDRRVSAHFEASLRRVLAYLLDGYDYVIRMNGDLLEVTVLNAASQHAVPAPVYAPPTYPVAKLRRDE